MTSAWFLGAGYGVDQDESVVRSTVEPVRHDGENTESANAPDFNEVETDDSGQLPGLAPRVVGSVTHDSVQFVPGWLDLASNLANVHTDSQVSTSGTAAQREARGEQGHGTMQYAEGIEPVIRDGATLGSEYFESAPTVIQDGAGEYMTPTDTDNWFTTLAQQNANADSRLAFQGTNYQSFLGG